MFYIPVTLAVEERKEGQKAQVIFNYIVGLKPAWNTCDFALGVEKKKNQFHSLSSQRCIYKVIFVF